MSSGTPVVSVNQLKQLHSENCSEAALQQMVVKELKKLGYRVLVTNAGIRKEAAKGLSGGKGAVFATPGIPDLFVRAPGYDFADWKAIELKTAKGKLSPAQAEIHNEGGSHICRSLQDVLDVLGHGGALMK